MFSFILNFLFYFRQQECRKNGNSVGQCGVTSQSPLLRSHINVKGLMTSNCKFVTWENNIRKHYPSKEFTQCNKGTKHLIYTIYGRLGNKKRFVHRKNEFKKKFIRYVIVIRGTTCDPENFSKEGKLFLKYNKLVVKRFGVEEVSLVRK